MQKKPNKSIKYDTCFVSVFTVLLPRSALSLGLKKFGTTNTTKKRFQTAPRVAPAVCVLGVLQLCRVCPVSGCCFFFFFSLFFFFFRLRRLVRAVPRATAASLAEVLGSGIGTSWQHSNMCIMGGITRYVVRCSAWCSALPCNQFQPYLLGLLFPSTSRSIIGGGHTSNIGPIFPSRAQPLPLHLKPSIIGAIYTYHNQHHWELPYRITRKAATSAGSARTGRR